MIENTLTRERAGLAQTNLENAMRQLNLANTLTEAAIRARLTSDRDVDRYLTNIYTNLSVALKVNVQRQCLRNKVEAYCPKSVFLLSQVLESRTNG
jgi:hypothetical protein